MATKYVSSIFLNSSFLNSIFLWFLVIVSFLSILLCELLSGENFKRCILNFILLFDVCR